MSNVVSRETHYVPITSILNGFVRRIVGTAAWFNVLLIFLILFAVILRYGFHRNQLLLGFPLVPLEELQWHLYSVPVMFGLAYAITNNTHIRIDIVHMRMSEKLQHFFEMFGLIFLLLPCLLVLLDFSFDYALYSYTHNESSQSTMGLPHLWIVKTVLPLSMSLMIIASIARLIQETVLFMYSSKESLETGLFKPMLKNNDNSKDGEGN